MHAAQMNADFTAKGNRNVGMPEQRDCAEGRRDMHWNAGGASAIQGQDPGWGGHPESRGGEQRLQAHRAPAVHW